MTDVPVRRVHIDLGEIARAAPPPAGAHLVTRPTGRAVRGAIETKLAGIPRAAVTVDFSRVSILDFSCADEVVAKLLLRHLDQAHPRPAYFLFRVLDAVRGHSISEVLARHRLAAVCDVCGRRFRLLGTVSPEERAAWNAVESRGTIAAAEIAAALGRHGEPAVRELARRRLVYRGADGAATALSALIHDRAPGAPTPTPAPA